MKVEEIMTADVITVTPEASWKEVTERLLDAGVSGLPVVDRDGYLVGVVTEADLVSKPAFGTRRHRSLEAVVDLLTGDARWAGKATALTAADLMTRDVITVAPGDDVRAAALRMLDRRVKRLPVVDAGRLVGIVSRRDLLRVFHRPDAEIAAALTARLGSARYAPEGHGVKASVEDGVVTLRGWVRTDADLPVIEGLAWRVPGVVHVVNEVRFHDRPQWNVPPMPHAH